MKRILLFTFAWLTASIAFASISVETHSIFLTNTQYKQIINNLFSSSDKKTVNHDFADGPTKFDDGIVTLTYSTLEEFSISYRTDDGAVTTLVSRDSDGEITPSEALNAYKSTDGFNYETEDYSYSTDPKQSANDLGSTHDYVKQNKLYIPNNKDITLFITDKDGNEHFGKEFSNKDGSFIGFDVDGDGKFDTVLRVGSAPDVPVTNNYSQEFISLIDAPNGDGFNKSLAYTSIMLAQIFNSDCELVPWVYFTSTGSGEMQGGENFVKCELRPDNYYTAYFSAIYSPEYAQGWEAHIVMIPKDETPETYTATEHTVANPFNTPEISIEGLAAQLGRHEVSPTQRIFTIEEAPFQITDSNIQAPDGGAENIYPPTDIFDALMSSDVKTEGNFDSVTSDGCDDTYTKFTNIVAEGEPLNYGSETERDLPLNLVLNFAVANPEVPMAIDILGFGIDNMYTKCDDYASHELVMETAATFYLPELPKVEPTVESSIILVDNPAYDEFSADGGASQAIAYQANISASFDITDVPFYDALDRSPVAKIYDANNQLIAEIPMALDGSEFSFNENILYDGVAQNFSISVDWTVRDDSGFSHTFTSVGTAIEIPALSFDPSCSISILEENYDYDHQAGLISSSSNSYSLAQFAWSDINYNSAIQSTNIIVYDKDDDDKIIYEEDHTSNAADSYVADEKECNFTGFTVADNPSGIRHFTYSVSPEYVVYSPTTPELYKGAIDLGLMSFLRLVDPVTADAVFVPDTLTDIDSINSDDVQVSARNGNIYVTGADTFHIFNAAGATIYSGNGSVVPVNPGLYIVKVGKASFKVIVK